MTAAGLRGSRGGTDPLLKRRLSLARAGRRLSFDVPHSVFATERIDEGTLLLLDHLPDGEPGTFLDLGCGYGALGLTVAGFFPRARGLLVDRDLLAVEFCRRNAEAQAAVNVATRGSLGFRGVAATERFDWVLCNVPARAGEAALESFLLGARARLTPGGELRIVVIGDLAPLVLRIAGRLGLAATGAAAGANHVVFSIPPGPGEDRGLEVYERDRIDVAGLSLVRPTDLADAPGRLAAAIPLLAECLPARAPQRILVFRCGYGLLPLLALRRYPLAHVVATDRDLLATAFTRRNCAGDAARLEVVEHQGLDGVAAAGPFGLVLGELSAPLGADATLAELAAARRLLAPDGRGLILAGAGQWRSALRPAAAGLGITLLGARPPAALLALRRD